MEEIINNENTEEKVNAEITESSEESTAKETVSDNAEEYPDNETEAPSPKKRRTVKRKTTKEKTDAEDFKNPNHEALTEPRTRRRKSAVGRLNDIVHDAYAGDMADGKILSIHGELKASTASQLILETAQDLAQSYAARTPLTANISEIYAPEHGTPRPVVVYKAFRIFLDPSDIIDDMSKLSEDETIRRKQIKAYLNRRIGSEIDFIVRDVRNIPGVKAIDVENRIAVGDRRAAMLQKRHAYWEPDINGKSVISEGSKVESRVVAVRQKSITVEVFGVEIQIPIEDVSYTYMEDLTQESPYKVGDYVNVLITQVDRSGESVKAKASIKMLCENKQLEEAKRMEALLEANGGITQVGQIVRVTIVNVFVKLDSGAVLRCPQRPNGRRAVVGDCWSVKVARADSSTGKIDGFLVYFIR
jgi:hypothetical protein